MQSRIVVAALNIAVARRGDVAGCILLQNNVLDRSRCDTRDELRIAIVTSIERTYHRRRLQTASGRLIPVEYETIMNPTATRAAYPNLSPTRPAVSYLHDRRDILAGPVTAKDPAALTLALCS
jgi:hypothetical protein